MNTDEFEGHTPGPWKLVEGDPYDELGCWLDIVSEHGNAFGPFEIQQCVGFSDGIFHYAFIHSLVLGNCFLDDQR